MALKILTKKDDQPPVERLPEGGDRFVWSEVPGVPATVPTPKKPQPYAKVLKYGQKSTP